MTNELMKQTIFNELEKLPAVINNKATKLFSLKNQLPKLEFDNEVIYQSILTDVKLSVVRGKVEFANSITRKAESDLRLSSDKTYQKNLKTIDTLKTRYDNLTLEHQLSRDKFISARYRAVLVGD